MFFSPNTKLQTDRKCKCRSRISKVVEVQWKESKGFTLISFIDSGSVETWGTVSPVKWPAHDVESRQAREGDGDEQREVKAQKRRTMPGRKRAGNHDYGE